MHRLFGYAVLVLAAALLREDTSYAYVADQTRPGMSLPLRLSSLWAGAAGSLLFFAAIAGTALLTGHLTAPAWQRVGVGSVVAGLAVTSWQGADPFERLALPPLEGAGMAPILEHYAMVLHPPLLYAGMCAALVPALVRDRAVADRASAAALTILTVALALGSAWAYVELGWGGWWAWDPIENVALIVWLLLAAALHWRQTGSPGAVVVWALCWPAVLGGTALTRTSLRTSVHAFADAATLSVWLWPLVTVSAVGAMWRIRESGVGRQLGPAIAGIDRGAVLRRLPQLLVVSTAVIIAAGTYRPFIGGDGTAGFFYSRTLFPIAVIGAALLGALPAARGGRTMAAAARVVVRWGLPVAATLTLAVAVAGWRAWYQLVLTAAVGLGLGALAAGGIRQTARFLAHLGLFAILFAAVAGTASTESVIRLPPGASGMVDGHRITVVDTAVLREEPLTVGATVLIDGRHTLTPTVAVYPERGLRLPEVATRTRPWLDVQVVLRDVHPEEGALLTVLFRPWNQLVWWGAGLLTAAGALLAVDRGRSTTDTGTRPSRVAAGDPARLTPPTGTEAPTAVQRPLG
ncbi:MAG: cytochrome c biogenesis protein CcsA [Actinomycetota bacterium]